MAIRSVVTRGYGNGTYSPGVSLVPTRGYLSGVQETDPTTGWTAAQRPAMFIAGQRPTVWIAKAPR